MPWVAGALSGHQAAYRYLAHSARHYYCGTQVAELLVPAGLSRTAAGPRILAVVTPYAAVKQRPGITGRTTGSGWDRRSAP
jgi:hypothetical protein